MGFFSSLKNFSGKAIGKFSGIARKIGDIAAPIARKIGDLAPVVGNVVGYGLDGLGGALGQPELIAAGEGIRRGANWVGGLAHKGADIGQKVSDIGGKAERFSRLLRDP